MKIEILGTGCAKCAALYDLATQTATELGIDCEIVKITDIREIAQRGIMSPPALFRDGKLVHSGKAPAKEEMARILQNS